MDLHNGNRKQQQRVSVKWFDSAHFESSSNGVRSEWGEVIEEKILEITYIHIQ